MRIREKLGRLAKRGGIATFRDSLLANVYLLIGTTIAVGLAIGSVLVHRQVQTNRIDRAVNDYHLATILDASRIESELQTLFGDYIQQEMHGSTRSGSVVERRQLTTIYHAIKRSAERIDTIQQQFAGSEFGPAVARLEESVEQLGVSVEKWQSHRDFEATVATPAVDTFARCEQLRMLHRVAVTELEDKAAKAQDIYSFVVMLGAVGVTGAAAIFVLLRIAAGSIRRREHSQQALDKAQKIARVGSWEYRTGAGTFKSSVELLRMLEQDADTAPTEPADLFRHIVHAEDKPLVDRWLQDAMRDGLCEPVEFRGHSRFARECHFRAELEVSIGRAGETDLLAGTIQDISREKRAKDALRASEAKLREVNATLEKRVAERTAELEETNAELSCFADSVSHDLRAPLRAIDGFAIALAEDYSAVLDEYGREYVDHIGSAAKTMEQLINDLLTYSRLGRSDISIRPTSLNEVVDKALEQLNADIEAAGAKIEVAADLLEVRAHERTLIQVVANLVSNGLKFVPTGSTPELSLWAEATKGGNRRLNVKDSGIGIPDEQRKQIFGVFERLHGIESYPGTGIGLAIVARACERLGGRCGVESRRGEGSCFWIEFPDVGADSQEFAA